MYVICFWFVFVFMLEFTIISEECLQNYGGGTLWVVIESSVFMLRTSHPVTYMRPAVQYLQTELGKIFIRNK